MTMTFVFNEEKARNLGCSTQACYNAVDKPFACYGIIPVTQGVYEAPDDQNTFTAFGVAQTLPYSDWFLKVIDSWFCLDDDGIPEDCLKVFYDVESKNCP